MHGQQVDRRRHEEGVRKKNSRTPDHRTEEREEGVGQKDRAPAARVGAEAEQGLHGVGGGGDSNRLVQIDDAGGEGTWRGRVLQDEEGNARFT